MIPRPKHGGAATLTGSGTLIAAGFVTRIASADLTGSRASLEASATRTVFGSAALAGTRSLRTGVSTRA